MRARILMLPFLLLLLAGTTAEATAPRIIKVLPQYLDLQGRHALTPSLFDRDAYQARLRRRPEDRSGLRFAIQWKASAGLYKLRVELRGAHGQEASVATLQKSVEYRGFFGKWVFLDLRGEDYKAFGELTAWRATLWEGDQKVGEQRSFLWQ